MKSGIYSIKNTVTGKVYVGSSINLARREKEHFRCLRAGRHVNIQLQRSWAKHGAEAFVFEVLEAVPVELLIPREQHWIDTLDTVKSGYNFAPTAGSTLGFRHSTETRAGMSLRRIGTTLPEATRQRISQANMGHALSPEHHARMLDAARSPEAIAKMVIGKTGHRHTEASRLKMSESHRGQKHSPETIEKMRQRIVSDETKRLQSEAATGRTHSPETIQKLKDRTFSDETRKKMSEAAKGRVVSKESTEKANATRMANRIAKGYVPKVPKKRGPMTQETKDKISAAKRKVTIVW